MTGTVVATPPTLPDIGTTACGGIDAASLARKRRREILLSQRAMSNPTGSVSATPAPPATTSAPTPQPTMIPDLTPSTVETQPPAKKAKTTTTVTTTSTKPGKAKKPQMKYDPDVPMTKEEAAVWRREQRRKRNRESAAASRQRQRDRIAELELELEGWKEKYAQIMNKVTEMERITQQTLTDDLIDSLPTIVSPTNCKGTVKFLDFSSSSAGRVSDSEASDNEDNSNSSSSDAETKNDDAGQEQQDSTSTEHHSDKMISRQA